MAWSVPAIAAATAAPAFAASSLTGCQTIAWTSFTGTEGTGGTLTADPGGGNTMSVSQQRTSGQAGNVNGKNYDFKRSAAGAQEAEANAPSTASRGRATIAPFLQVPSPQCSPLIRAQSARPNLPRKF